MGPRAQSPVPQAPTPEDDALSPLLQQLAAPPETQALAPGVQVGRYAIVGHLGAGGMGEVYRASDSRLGREVAIKLLSSRVRENPESHRRFEQEALAIGRLSHPNVLAVFDVGDHEGRPYLVTELLQGKTLRERLGEARPSTEQCISWAAEIASALAATHKLGVVHRDLKPENIFITAEGRAKVLDFGLAKSLSPEGVPAQGTAAGALLGTVGYMSPEQARGEPADARSDLFSLGAVLYEMLCGWRAFRRGSPVETLHAIIHDPPPPFAEKISPALEQLVRKCLEKRPEDRFQSAGEVAAALAAGGTKPRRRFLRPLLAVVLLAAIAAAALSWPRPGPAPSIAVLPFVNLSADRDNEFFSDGMTEEIIDALANVEGVRVVARTSAFSFKGKNVNVREIGSELGVATVLEGSVRREGNQLRVVAQLIDARDGYHRWSKTYDRELKNVFAVENELARAIVEALTPKLLPSAALVPEATASTEAHDLVLRGRYLSNQRTRESLIKAQSLFEQAIALDPAYALAYSSLADCFSFELSYRVGGAELIPKAKTFALKAVQLDESLAEGHASLGTAWAADYEWASAEHEYRRALDLRPGYAIAHHWYALILMTTGRMEQARAEEQRAGGLDPTSWTIGTGLAISLYLSQQYDAAIVQLKKALQLEPAYPWARYWLALSYQQTGRTAEALAVLDQSTPCKVARALVLARSGDRRAAQQILAELESVAPAQRLAPGLLALVHVSVGDNDGAVTLLEQGYAERDHWGRTLKNNPNWDPLRKDPRFQRLLREMHLD